jgi:hypothetical protein
MQSNHTNKREEKKMMINDIIRYSDLYNSRDKLESKEYTYIRRVYYSCLIPIFKGISSQESKNYLQS